MFMKKKLHFGKWKLRKAAYWINYKFDHYVQHYNEITDTRDYLQENGIDYPFPELKSPEVKSTADAREVAHYWHKAFAAAVVGETLYDKFNFQPKKTNQMMEAVIKMYDYFVAHPKELDEYRKHVYETYNIWLERRKGDYYE